MTWSFMGTFISGVNAAKISSSIYIGTYHTQSCYFQLLLQYSLILLLYFTGGVLPLTCPPSIFSLYTLHIFILHHFYHLSKPFQSTTVHTATQHPYQTSHTFSLLSTSHPETQHTPLKGLSTLVGSACRWKWGVCPLTFSLPLSRGRRANCTWV